MALLLTTLFIYFLYRQSSSYQDIRKLAATSLIWIARIAFDRLLGYDLQYPTHFKDTTSKESPEANPSVCFVNVLCESFIGFDASTAKTN